MERGQWEKSGYYNYDSAMPLLHWLKLHKKRQMRLKGEMSETYATQNGQQPAGPFYTPGGPRRLAQGIFLVYGVKS
jgi:hypothetical protein